MSGFSWSTSLRKIIYGFLLGVISGILLLSTAWWLGSAIWRTESFRGQLIAKPRTGSPTGLVVVIGPDDAPKLALWKWCDERNRDLVSVSLLNCVPEREWWDALSLDPIAAHGLQAIADGDSASLLWLAWQDGTTSRTSILLTNPSDITPQNTSSGKLGRLALRLSKSSPFIDITSIQLQTKNESNISLEIVTNTKVSWWTP